MTMAAPYTDSGNKDSTITCENTQESDMRNISAAADTHCNSSTDERLDDSAWLSVERHDSKRTSPPKSPLEEVTDAEDNGIKKELSTSEYISPLMAPPIHISNYDNDRSLQPHNNATHLMSSDNHLVAETSMIYEYSQDNQNNTHPTIPTNNDKQSLIQKYRTFLQQNQLSIDLLENIMERFVFYGYLFKEHDHSGISTELYYAIWNSIRWFNDVVLVGWGEGMGFTIGKRDEWLSHNCTSLSEEKRVSLSDLILSRLNSVVPILRAILTATTCIYPAMEAWSRRSIIHSSRSLLDNGENNSIIRQSRAAQVSYRLERIKFVARLALLSISWYAQQHRRRRNQQQDDNNNQQKERIPTLLRRGGELDPYEELVHLQDADDEVNIVQYVGRRTGRRSIAARPSLTAPSSPTSSHLSSVLSSSIISNVTILIKRLAKLLSSKHRIVYVYAVGELLHILRPLYWSHAETRQYQKQRRLSAMNIPQKQSSLNSSYSFGIWRAYFISLMMDLISDKLLQLSDGGDTSTTRSESHRRGSLFRGSIGGRPSSSAPSSSAEQAKRDELDWRRSRHSLYLLRSPMYNTVTQPVATLLGRVVSMIPSFGLGEWAVEYVLDMMSYWNENHFMLES